jgi:hypothetical protein
MSGRLGARMMRSERHVPKKETIMTTATGIAPATAAQLDGQRSDPDAPGALRAAAVAGVLFVVLDVGGTLAAGAPPASDASSARIARYFAGHTGGIKLQLFLGGLGVVALMWWFGALWRMLARAEGERPRLAIVAAVGLASGVTMAMMSSAFTATGAIHLGPADSTALLYRLSLVAAAGAGFGIGAALIAACVVTYRSRATARWISALGLFAGVVFLIGTAATATDESVVNMLGLAAFLVWCVWILAISAHMWRQASAAAA